MRLDFSILSAGRKNCGGQREHGGQLASMPVVPNSARPIGMLKTFRDEGTADLLESRMLSLLSPEMENDWGHKSPRVDAAVPTAPAVPKEKLLSPFSSINCFTLLQILQCFRFDLVEAEIAQGYPAGELDRVNNMAWAFMLGKQMSFLDALQATVEVVMTCAPAVCEQEYANVRAMWNRLVNEAMQP